MLQIQIVSHQLQPNFIGFLLTKPSRVLLLTTNHQTIVSRANRLKRFYKASFNVEADIFDVGELGFYAHHLAQARSILDNVKSQGFDISKIEINATGGSKPLADAFKQAVLENQGAAFYCHTELKQLEYYHPAKFIDYSQAPSIDLEQILNIQGYQFVSEQAKLPWQDVTQALGDYFIKQHSSETVKVNAQLNQRAIHASANNLTLSTADEGFNRLNSASVDLNNYCQNRLHIDPIKKCITFSDLTFAKFLCGQWFEQWLYLQAKQAAPDHLYLGVEIQDEDNAVLKQELDIVLIHNHQLLFLECKTSKSGYLNSKDINRLVQLSRNLGALTKVCFVSLNGVNTDTEARLKREGIDYIVEQHIAHIADYFKEWVANTEKTNIPLPALNIPPNTLSQSSASKKRTNWLSKLLAKIKSTQKEQV